jgi:hypothetical protein
MLKSEPELILKLGEGPEFVSKVYRRFLRQFSNLHFDSKRCSAYLNLIANIRMLDGSLWTDAAVDSMFRRCMLKGKMKKCRS